MGSSFGCVMLYNVESRPQADLEAAFRALLAASVPAQGPGKLPAHLLDPEATLDGMPAAEYLEKYHRQLHQLLAASGYYRPSGGAMLLRPGSPWVSTLEKHTISGFDAPFIGPHVQKYADHFGLPAMALSCFDSDLILLAFCAPGQQSQVYGRTNTPSDTPAQLLEEHGLTPAHMVFPAPLAGYADPDTLAQLQAAWAADLVFTEDFLYQAAGALNFDMVRDEHQTYHLTEGDIYIPI